MAKNRTSYTDMNEILDILFDDSDVGSDIHIDLQNSNDCESILDYENEELLPLSEEERADNDLIVESETEEEIYEESSIDISIESDSEKECYETQNLSYNVSQPQKRVRTRGGNFLSNHPEKANNSYLKNWKAVRAVEMKTFFGLIILMGIVHKPNLSMYWSTNDLYWTPIFSKTMSQDRFKVILKFLHFNNNNDPNHNPNDPNRELHKVRPFLNMIKERCRKVYSPGQHLSVDELLVLFKGRLHFRQYIKTRRARFGIKVYELTTADGITLDFLVYCGIGMYDDDKNSTMSSSQRIPIELMGPD
ncbi:piggyBac transposable element-derived protein 4 [Hydra vulgaris]|uniref:piggyBac transposable element-derived protein 4 n=1 Tax=Hydra vulgaris TaxID=6087 RepID=UPI001F5E3DE5|nr:piggyBac transposable element-derived protein 4-like [Hydra vulgaris]